jgi:hypothetical protein
MVNIEKRLKSMLRRVVVKEIKVLLNQRADQLFEFPPSPLVA